MPAPLPSRRYSHNSFTELEAHRKLLGAELSVHLYLLPKLGFIVAPLDGIAPHVEAREVTVLPENAGDGLLGQAVCDNLLWQVAQAPDHLRDLNTADWPVFAASGCKTVSKFEGAAIMFTIGTCLNALRIEAIPRRHVNLDHCRVAREIHITASHDKIGENIREALKAVAHLQAADYY